MNKHNSSSILNTFFLIAIALSSGCGSITPISSPAVTVMPAHALTKTATPNPTITPKPISPEGTIFYSDFTTLYAVDLKSRQTKIVFQLSNTFSYEIADNSIYVTLPSEKNKFLDVFRTNFDGMKKEQLTTDGAIQVFSIDPQKHYLVYNNRNVSLLILDLWNKKSQVIAERNKNAQGIEWIFANSWSPDGKKLIYRRVLNPAADDICTLFVYDTDRKESIELSPAEKTGCFAAWSPEGENIALPGASGIYIFNVQTTERYRIPFDNLTYLYLEDLFWSGNREKLFFSGNQKIYALDLNSHQLEVIARYSDRFNSFIPSPDKNMMLYEEEMRTSKTDLHLFDITKKNNKKIYSHESILSSGKTLDKINWRYSSVWSPDGEYFAYFTTSEPDNYSRKWTRPITLNIYGVETGNSVSFEVPTKSGYMVFGTYWVYPKQQQ